MANCQAQHVLLVKDPEDFTDEDLEQNFDMLSNMLASQRILLRVGSGLTMCCAGSDVVSPQCCCVARMSMSG